MSKSIQNLTQANFVYIFKVKVVIMQNHYHYSRLIILKYILLLDY